MKKMFFWLLFTPFQLVSANQFEPEIQLEQTTLKQCSAVPIKVMLFNLGDVALYRQQCSSGSPLTIQPVQLSFIYNRGFDAEDFQTSSVKLLKRNVEPATFSAIEASLLEFNAGYEEAKQGDRFDIRYSPEQGLTLFKNGQQLSQSNNTQLGQTYFDIWFGDDPFSEKMKDNLLAGLK